ncbi:hypothetical protein PoB_001962200 [Plakobranchus ocellatus]|uniref:SMB domain-containing protein n=1 Tax=Plakobranchus ocellatus TaxID=259542 RepID=A0AAV3ZF56_9GAST|nr:hypothetical protein PoB_001962200 [Plakobranchus ocellatus]
MAFGRSHMTLMLANLFYIYSTCLSQNTFVLKKPLSSNPIQNFPKVDRSTHAASTVDFTIPYRDEDSECQQIAFDYVYRENICGAPDPDTYMETAKARYTCKDRCGDVPIYGKDLFDCACDERCIAHRDCCRDFSVACPDIHTTGKIRYSHVMDHVYTSCHEHDFQGFHQTVSSWPTTTIFTTQKDESSLLKQSFFEPRKAFGSSLLKDVFYSFRVGDLSLNILSDNFDSFKLFAKSSSIPKFVPSVATLLCPYASSKYIRNAAEVFESCLVTYLMDIVTPLHRNCRMDQLISCYCNSIVKYNQHVHNVCMGQNVSPLTQLLLWNYQAEFEKQLNDGAHCNIFNFTERRLQNPPSGKEQRKDGNIYSMTVSPIFAELVARSRENNTSHNDRVGDHQFEEKRLRCASLDIMVKECRLEECVHGAVMSNTENSLNYFGNRSCVIPVLATVSQGDSHMTVPLCSCLRVMSALSALQM